MPKQKPGGRGFGVGRETKVPDPTRVADAAPAARPEAPPGGGPAGGPPSRPSRPPSRGYTPKSGTRHRKLAETTAIVDASKIGEACPSEVLRRNRAAHQNWNKLFGLLDARTKMASISVDSAHVEEQKKDDAEEIKDAFAKRLLPRLHPKRLGELAVHLKEAYVQEERRSAWHRAGAKLNIMRSFKRPVTPMERKIGRTYEGSEIPLPMDESGYRFDRQHHKQTRRAQLALKSMAVDTSPRNEMKFLANVHELSRLRFAVRAPAAPLSARAYPDAVCQPAILAELASGSESARPTAALRFRAPGGFVNGSGLEFQGARSSMRPMLPANTARRPKAVFGEREHKMLPDSHFAMGAFRSDRDYADEERNDDDGWRMYYRETRALDAAAAVRAELIAAGKMDANGKRLRTPILGAGRDGKGGKGGSGGKGNDDRYEGGDGYANAVAKRGSYRDVDLDAVFGSTRAGGDDDDDDSDLDDDSILPHALFDKNTFGSKHAEGECISGIVTSWSDGPDFGWIQPDDGGEELIGPLASITDGDMLKQGARVKFVRVQGDNGGGLRACAIVGGHWKDGGDGSGRRGGGGSGLGGFGLGTGGRFAANSLRGGHGGDHCPWEDPAVASMMSELDKRIGYGGDGQSWGGGGDGGDGANGGHGADGSDGNGGMSRASAYDWYLDASGGAGCLMPGGGGEDFPFPHPYARHCLAPSRSSGPCLSTDPRLHIECHADRTRPIPTSTLVQT